MTPDLLRGAVWKKSSRSGGNGGQCVELAVTDEHAGVRDSKNPDGGVLIFPRAKLNEFLGALRGTLHR